MLVRAHFTIIHYFAWGLQGEYGLDVDWKLAFSGVEMMSFVSRLKKVEELNHFSPMGIGSADSSRLAKGGIAWPILTYFQKTQSRP
jgi:hypothetical protein